MANISLVEYWAHVSTGYQLSGNTLVFDPLPNSVVKSVKVKWRLRRPGFQRKIERGRFRYNEEITFAVTGSCPQEKRDEIEFYSKRDSLFKIINCDMKTYHTEQTSDSTNPPDSGTEIPTYQLYTNCKNQDCGEGAGMGEPVFVIFEDAKFTQKEGKTDWFDYAITLHRVHLGRH